MVQLLAARERREGRCSFLGPRTEMTDLTVSRLLPLLRCPLLDAERRPVWNTESLNRATASLAARLHPPRPPRNSFDCDNAQLPSAEN
jgi:hypothetical protein